MWIVMTSSAHQPSSHKWKHEMRNVALVHISQEYAAKGLVPAMISERAKGVCKLSTMRRAIIHMGACYVGTTARCEYQRTLRPATETARQLNNATPEAQNKLLMSWGGSA